MSKIEIKKESVLDAYKNANNEQKELLEHLFGNEVFKPVDVRKRIKTFADAAKAVGIDDPEEWEEQYSNLEPDILAYFKLRIITKALNEGWEPSFIPGEGRWIPNFLFIDGVSYAYSVYDSLGTSTNIGSRLTFKSAKLAEYAGKQFLDIYSQFLF